MTDSVEYDAAVSALWPLQGSLTWVELHLEAVLSSVCGIGHLGFMISASCLDFEQKERKQFIFSFLLDLCINIFIFIMQF